jgi:hypothetical protein
MTTTTCQTSIDPSQIQSILESIGYKLLDFGNHWRTNALYRGGDNKTAIRIYKNSGVWTDFVNGTSKSFPIERLIQLTLNTNPKKMHEVLASLKKGDEFVYSKKETIEMEEVYPESMLEKLFPNYHFYKNKGISEETLKTYKTGLAGAGKMYRRMVFPIYDEHSQIIGFSGRKVDENNEAPKWKHLGKRKQWIYPAYIPQSESVDSIIKEKREVILVESIGDSMALYEQGFKNNLVTFGLGCSSSIINYLNSFDIQKIIIAANNDEQSNLNHGKISSIKILMSLRSFFDFEKIEIKMPPYPFNDFSDAHQNGFNLKNWYNNEIDRGAYLNELMEFVVKHKPYFKVKESDSLIKFLENYG